MKTVLLTLTCLLAFSTTSMASAAIYVNDDGCTVETENRANGLILYVTDANKKAAVVGVLHNLSSGTIYSFCQLPEVKKSGEVVTLSCQEGQNDGRHDTRGQAMIDFSNGLSSVAVKGEYKGLLGWKTDTDIQCDRLRLQN